MLRAAWESIPASYLACIFGDITYTKKRFDARGIKREDKKNYEKKKEYG